MSHFKSEVVVNLRHLAFEYLRDRSRFRAVPSIVVPVIIIIIQLILCDFSLGNKVIHFKARFGRSILTVLDGGQLSL